MNNPILDDHLLEKEEQRVKKSSRPIFIGFSRFLFAQGLMTLFVHLLVSGLKADQEPGLQLITMLILVIAAFITMFIVMYNLVLGWEKLTNDQLFEYGDGTFGGIVIIASIFVIIILSILILYGEPVVGKTIAIGIPTILFLLSIKWLYDTTLQKNK